MRGEIPHKTLCIRESGDGPDVVCRFSSSRRGFSLLELLVVVAIMGVMAALIVPAVNGFGRSAALTNAGSMVTNLATLARQDAMAKNTITALVMLADAGTPQDFRAFTVLEYHLDHGWWQIGNWELLPEGVAVDRSDTTNCTFLAHSPNPFPYYSQPGLPVKFQQTAVGTAQGFAARIFTPTGHLQNAEYPAQIRLVEGYTRGTSVIYTRRGVTTGTANYYDIAIVGATGNAKISRP